MELFYSEGPEIVREIRKMGHKVFLDLKLHDIPNTVKSAMKSILRLDADMVNLHASGGSVMMEEAMNACREEGKKPLVIAVTQLTSTTEELMQSELLIDRSLTETVLSYAENAKKAGLSGVVCSALEVPVIKEHLGEGFITVTPGIRPLDSAAGDQKRIVTPARARELGSDYIVVGRPITRAEDPEKAYKEIKKEFLGV
jgi:orotidine-5'-phosphate decarboxylase